MKGCFPPNAVMPTINLVTANSPNCAWHRTAGYATASSHRINPGAVTSSTNIFQIVGDVEIKALYGRMTDVTNVVGGPTACSWDLYDGAATVQLTSAAGTSLAGASVNSIVLKDAAAANALTLLNSNQCRMSELTVGGAARPFFGCLVAQKDTTATYIRFTCTTLVYAIWACRYPGSSLVAV
jgi:hypothetical protein